MTCFFFYIYIYILFLQIHGFQHFEKRSLSLVNRESYKYPTVKKKTRETKTNHFDKKKPKEPGKIKANFAKFNEKKKFYEAKGNVRITTNENQMFAMQSVFWDQNKRLIYTSDTVYVTDKDGSTLVGANGMKAKDDFSEYTFYNNSGESLR